MAAPSRAELTLLANMERQRKDGIIATPKKADSRHSAAELASTQLAMPARDTSLTLLDLKHPPTEAELIKAGQLLGPLSPTDTADSGKLTDPAAKVRKEQDNLLFGQAMNAWNRNQYTEALSLFASHLKEYPASSWAAESRLHLALASMERGNFVECLSQADRILKATSKGTGAYQKALLLKAQTLVGMQRMDEAAQIYGAAMTTETDARRRSTASSWLVALSQARKK